MTLEQTMKLLGPGLYWDKSREEIERAISKAKAQGDTDTADRLAIILELRDDVAMEKKSPTK